MWSPIVRATALFTSCIFGAVLLFYVACQAFDSPDGKTGLILVLMVIKVSYFITATLGWIHLTVTSTHHRRYLLGFLVLQMLLIVLSFGLDYHCLYRVDPASFHVPLGSQRPREQFLTFLYFSLGKYTTAGVGDIHPVSPAARLCAMGEMVVAYFTTVLIIANVGYLQAWFGREPEAH